MTSTNLKVVEYENPAAVVDVEPPASIAADLDAAVAFVCACLHQARGDDVPAAMVKLIDFLLPEALDRTKPRPTEAHREKLLAAQNASRWLITKHLAEHFPYEEAYRGMDAIWAVLIHWEEDDVYHVRRCPDVMPDLRDYLEIFRNQIRNVALLAAIEGRRQWRLDDNISELHPAFCAEGAA